MDRLYFTIYVSPLGELTLVSDGTSLTKCLLPNEILLRGENIEENSSLPVLNSAKKYLDAYFSGSGPLILPPLLLSVSAYTASVLAEALKIPYGETISYHELARRLATPRHARAVGNALGRNPLPIFIPCHRILKSDNTLGGYSGGLHFKIKLLEHERQTKGNNKI